MPSTRVVAADFRVPPVDPVALETRAAELASRSIKKDSKRQGLLMAIAMTDLTTLEGKDSPGKVRNLCRRALRPLAGRADVPSVAAVCVYPDLVQVAARELRGSGVAVASVATAFPAGRTDLALKVEEVRRAIADGAVEIDMVLDRGAFHAGRYGAVFDQVCQVRDACGAAVTLKVILETGELVTLDNVRRACRIALLGGADFLKTSTGKVAPAATPPLALLLLECVRDWYLETGRLVGVKVAGGIRSAKEALRYLVLVHETCGDLWLTPERFRFGASTLLHDLLMQLVWVETGRYPRPEDLGVD